MWTFEVQLKVASRSALHGVENTGHIIGSTLYCDPDSLAENALQHQATGVVDVPPMTSRRPGARAIHIGLSSIKKSWAAIVGNKLFFEGAQFRLALDGRYDTLLSGYRRTIHRVLMRVIRRPGPE